MSRMGIPSLAQFKGATNPKSFNLFGKVKVSLKGRGSNMGHVDAALELWEQNYATASNEQKALILYELYKACHRWLKLKETKKDSELSSKRKIQVRALRELAAKALDQLVPGFKHFHDTKLSRMGKLDPKFTSLSRGYHLERQNYLSQGKQGGVAVAFSRVGEIEDFVSKGIPMETREMSQREQRTYERTLGKHSSQLTLDEFLLLVEKTVMAGEGGDKSKLTAYMNKLERLQYMAVINDGKFEDVNGQLLDNKDLSWDRAREEMYAMDRYGQLFIKDGGTLSRAGYFNHSSLNAGRDVICAGMIVIRKGILDYIDNASGHYKPDKDALYAALTWLAEEGAALDGTKVSLFAGEGKPMPSYRALTFLETPNAQPDWKPEWDELLGLSAKA